MAASPSGYQLSTLTTGHQILGGFETDFVGPRDENPATNGTSVSASPLSFEVAATASGALDGFTILRSAPLITNTPRDLMRISGSSTFTLRNTVLAPTSSTTQGTESRGIQIYGSGSGSVQIGPGVTIQSPRGSTSSTGLLIAAGSGAEVRVEDSEIQPGLASTTWGIRHLGSGALDLVGGHTSGGTGNTSTGLFANGAVVQLNDATVKGGTGSTAVAIDIELSPSFTMQGGSAIGEGSSASAAEATGVRLTDVGVSTLSNASVVGAAPLIFGTSTLSVAVDMKDTMLTGSSLTIDDGSVVDGGALARTRIGVRCDSAACTVRDSILRGSGSGGGQSATGIYFVGSVPAGVRGLIEGNTLVVGSEAPFLETGATVAAVAVLVGGDIPVTVTQNQSVMGSKGFSTGEAKAVSLSNGSGHRVTFNTQVLGGEGLLGSSVDRRTAIYALETDVTIADNGLVIGSQDSAAPACVAEGIYGRLSSLIIERNGHISGGFGQDCGGWGHVVGVISHTASSDPHGVLTLRDNSISGGFSPEEIVGVAAHGDTVLLAERNVVRGCDSTTVENDCSLADVRWERAFATSYNAGSLVKNNFFFSSVGSACVFGCMPYLGSAPRGYSCSGTEQSLDFEHNLCHGPKSAEVQFGGSVGAPSPRMRNNIFHATSSPVVATLSHNLPLTLIENNTFHTDSQTVNCLYGPTSGSPCYATLADITAADLSGDVVASNNVSIAPDYLGPDLSIESAEPFHHGAACNLGGLGQVSALTPEDFDGEARGAVGPPDLGPDECP